MYNIFEHTWYFFYILALKIIKKNGLDLKNFHFLQTFSQTIWKKYVAMATMICVKRFMNILDIFLNSWFKNNLRKKKGFIWIFFIFHKNLGGTYVAMATTIKCVSKVLKFKVYSTNIISCKYWSNIYKDFKYRAKTKKMLNFVIFLQNNSAYR